MNEHSLSVLGEANKVTSREVAERFGKEHKHVLEAIRNLECSEEFNRSNFRPAEYADAKGEKRPEYHMTRDGFSLLCMGFTGEQSQGRGGPLLTG